MKTLMTLFFSLGMFTALAQKVPVDTCHTLFDHTEGIVSTPIAAEELASFDSLYFSLNQCTNEIGDTIAVCEFRLITVPVKGNATLRTFKQGDDDTHVPVLSEEVKREIRALPSGSRIIFEQIYYRYKEQKHAMQPLIYTIE